MLEETVKTWSWEDRLIAAEYVEEVLRSLQQGPPSDEAADGADLYLRLAWARFGALTKEQERRLRATDLDQIRERVLSVESLEELMPVSTRRLGPPKR